MVKLMLSSCENWNAVCFFAKEVLIYQRIIESARTTEIISNFTSPDVIPDCDSGGNVI